MVSKIVRNAAAGLVCTLITAGSVVGQNAGIEVVGVEGSSWTVVAMAAHCFPIPVRGKSSCRTTSVRRDGCAKGAGLK